MLPSMRPSLFRLANTSSKVNLNASSLYLPIPLYRRLLRAHRHLPPDMRSLGDEYVKSEFRRHKDVTNPAYIMGFLSQWNMYLNQMPRSNNVEFKGKKLDPTMYEKMSEEQIQQLHDLMNAARVVGKD